MGIYGLAGTGGGDSSGIVAEGVGDAIGLTARSVDGDAIDATQIDPSGSSNAINGSDKWHRNSAVCRCKRRRTCLKCEWQCAN